MEAEEVPAVQLTLDVSAVSSMVQLFQACRAQISVGASNLDGLRDSLQYAGQKEGFDVDRDEFRAVELRVIGFARCKAFLLQGSKHVGDAVEEILQSHAHLNVTFNEPDPPP